MHGHLIGIAVVSVFVTSVPALAQHAEAPDVVQLKDGGMIRGTISELVPGDFVVIVPLRGEIRRIPMRDVIYAGPTGGPPGSEPRQAGVQVHFTSPHKDVTLHEQIASTSYGSERMRRSQDTLHSVTYRRLCTAPCDATLPPGKALLGLSREDGVPVPADDAVDLTGSAMQLEGRFSDYATVRGVGWFISLAGGATGATLAAVSIFKKRDPGESFDPSLAIGGLITASASIVIGGILSSIEDDAEIIAVPE